MMHGFESFLHTENIEQNKKKVEMNELVRVNVLRKREKDGKNGKSSACTSNLA